MIQTNIGVSAVINDSKFNLIPQELQRLERRNKYEEDPTHSSLKDKRDKRDELKEKKFKAQQKPIDIENPKNEENENG